MWLPMLQQGVAVDRHTGAYLARNVVPYLSHEGQKMTVAKLRAMCAAARAKGWEVFPHDGCDNFDDKGRCQGHEEGWKAAPLPSAEERRFLRGLIERGGVSRSSSPILDRCIAEGWVQIESTAEHVLVLISDRGRAALALAERHALDETPAPKHHHPSPLARVAIADWGIDHWTTFLYVALAIAHHRPIERDKMRTDPARHPHLMGGLAAIMARMGREDPKVAETKLKGGRVLAEHDDWDCLEDAERVGLLVSVGSGITPRYELCAAGWQVLAQLTAHRDRGGDLETFLRELDVPEGG